MCAKHYVKVQSAPTLWNVLSEQKPPEQPQRYSTLSPTVCTAVAESLGSAGKKTTPGMVEQCKGSGEPLVSQKVESN